MKTNFPLHYVRRTAALSSSEHWSIHHEEVLHGLRGIIGITNSGEVDSATERLGSAVETLLKTFHCTNSWILPKATMLIAHDQGFSQMMRRVHLDCKSRFTESRSLEFFLREARMQRVEWMVKESKRPSGRRGEA